MREHDRAGEDTGLIDDAEQTSTMPRWVRVFIAVLLILGLIVLALQLTGDHGPRRHLSSSESAALAGTHAR